MKDLTVSPSKRQNRLFILILLLLLIILALLILFCIRSAAGSSFSFLNLFKGQVMTESTDGELVAIGEGTPPLGVPIDESASDWDGTLPSSGVTNSAGAESIAIPGYSRINLSKESPAVSLINPDGNTVYMVYRIYVEDEEIYESGAIAPGKTVAADLAGQLESGEYTAVFLISTYDCETMSACNGARLTVRISVN